MKQLALISGVALFVWAGPASAETVFAVTSEDVDECSTLSEYTGYLAEMRDTGATREKLLNTIPQEVSEDVRTDLVNIVMSAEAGDPGFVKKITGALCILERLQPREAQ
ncbi:hypothetical protein [Roseovarius sp. A46]|uniref:hypothetical protein n=1 Tax=Roseovarius sp. A46 TaxID=2109331 RepID=UPI0010108C34|nr:hypothetical protein [Roseovarius sp. A46]